jgi:nitrous oxidase accessory protein
MPVRVIILVLAAVLFGGLSARADDLQALIDAAPEGSELTLPAGVHPGPLVIGKSLVIDGAGQAIIDGGGKGTVVTIAADAVTLKNLTIRNSGRLHNQVDAGLRIKSDFNVIRDVVIETSLFGIDMTEADNNVLRRNQISSKDMPLEIRGDSVRLWYSHDNKFQDNLVTDSRDIVVWYSHGNHIEKNRIQRGRYGIHFMYSHENFVEENEISDCVVGIFLMYSNDLFVRRNKFLRSWGASGMGVGFKETSGAVVEDNEIIGNAVGIYLDPSPWDPDKTNEFNRNTIAYNGIGVEFHTDWVGNNFRENAFLSNFTQVSVRGRGTALREGWLGNHWDDYAGFDRDADGKGDAPYEVYMYADQIWMDVPPAAFFRGGLALAALDFVERLAPFSEPRLLLRETGSLTEKPLWSEVDPATHAGDQPGRKKTALELLQE